MSPFVVFSCFSQIHRHLNLKAIELNLNLQTNIYTSNFFFLKQKALHFLVRALFPAQ